VTEPPAAVPLLPVDVLFAGVDPSAGKSFGSRPTSLADDTDCVFARFGVCVKCGGRDREVPFVCCYATRIAAVAVGVSCLMGAGPSHRQMQNYSALAAE